MNYVTNSDNSPFSSPAEQRLVYTLVAVAIFSLTLGILAWLDWLPEPKATTESAPSSLVTDTTASPQPETVGAPGTAEPLSPVLAGVEARGGEEVAPATPPPLPAPVDFEADWPRELRIDYLDRTVAILNPQSRAVADLDAALLEGVVRHPDSADFTRPGTMLILGHSSYLPNVFNKNFQAFNGIQNLPIGTSIRLYSDSHEYVYVVTRVYEAKASSAEIPLQWEEHHLVLATCDSFGSTDDRFIVEARLLTSGPV
jgi:hypothetical protein